MDLNRTLDFIGHLELGGIWLGVDLRTDSTKTCFKRDWATCSKYVNHSRFESHYKLGGDLYDHLMNTKIFTLIVIKIFIGAPNTCEANGYGHDLESVIISH